MVFRIFAYFDFDCFHLFTYIFCFQNLNSVSLKLLFSNFPVENANDGIQLKQYNENTNRLTYLHKNTAYPIHRFKKNEI